MVGLVLVGLEIGVRVLAESLICNVDHQQVVVCCVQGHVQWRIVVLSPLAFSYHILLPNHGLSLLRSFLVHALKRDFQADFRTQSLLQAVFSLIFDSIRCETLFEEILLLAKIGLSQG